MTIRVFLHDKPLPETGSLTCAHCRLPHAVTREMQERYEAEAVKAGVSPDLIWECGKCYVAHLAHLTGQPPLAIKVECAHPVPPFPQGGEQ